MQLDPWPFIIGSYVIAGIGTIGMVVASYVAMRRAEKAADALRERS